MKKAKLQFKQSKIPPPSPDTKADADTSHKPIDL